jgi:DNA replication licensing factor MCM6
MDAGSIIDGLADKFTRFLGTYSPADYVAPDVDQDGEDGSDAPASFMARTVQEMATNNETTLYVDFKHISDFDYDMADKILQHYERCEPVLRDSLKNYIRQHHEQFIKDAHGPEKEFFVGIHGLHSIDRLRDLRTEHIGRLSAFSGTVTRTSDVRPELFLGTFRCQHCATTVKNVEQFYKFTEPLVCPSASCNNRWAGVLSTSRLGVLCKEVEVGSSNSCLHSSRVSAADPVARAVAANSISSIAGARPMIL